MTAFKWINTVAFTVMITANALAEIIPLGGKTTGEISESYPNLFTPAPFTFFIWGIIYLMLLAFTLWQLTDKKAEKFVKKAGIWFTLSCLANTAWIFCWHYELIGWSVISMTVLLVTLIVLNKKMSAGERTFKERLLGNYGFEIYFGWIIAATVANITVWLVKNDRSIFGISEEIMMLFVLLIVTLIAEITVLYGRFKLAGAAVMWALSGILAKHIAQIYYAGQYTYVIIACIAALIIIDITVSMELLRELSRVDGGIDPAELFIKNDELDISAE